MPGSNIKLIVNSVLLICIFCNSGCDKQNIQETGYLEGKISIGPICPVESVPPNPDCLPTAETYKAYPVIIWTSDGKDKVTQLKPDLDGSYIVELDPGKYLIKLEKEQNTIGSSNLPVEISIVSRKETIFNIDIDTGIR